MFTVELKVLIAGGIDIKIDCVIIYVRRQQNNLIVYAVQNIGHFRRKIVDIR